ncbi:hypothetical protein AVEN_106820-1 [Araneus ventricosus]|uniref:Retrovirus-related Pol polyprotein from type-1 retrotransposable element R1 n=1 Tax=Araneus ventricosus TaxID=182803 RepID=A0A4Y2S021_ARAVE|nr:hypothetical protein AVEN_106820-1 [Araneus ventricosus]
MQTSEGPFLWEQTQGCPQGSCSWPAFWNIVADKILSVQWPQRVYLQAFADDFAFIVTDNTSEGLRKLSKLALDKFKKWADKNKLHVSMEKSSYVLFSKPVRGPLIKWGNQSISRKNHLKYLGVTIDHKLSWLPHVIEQGKKAMDQYQHLCRIAGKTWGINKNIRRLLTTPTAALQVVTGLQPLHLQIQQEATYARVARARSSSNFFTVIFRPTDYESKCSGIHIHPPNFLLHNQISFAENHIDSGAKAIYTDGSKTDEDTGSAFCILENCGIIASWQGKLDRSNSVFQAEILAIRMATEAASSVHRPIKIWTDSLSSLMAILNPKSHHSMVREIQTLLLSHKYIHLRWLKAHVGYLGNECADQLAKEAITKGDPFFLPKPLSYLKSEIKSAALSIWQDNWGKEKLAVVHTI